MEHLEMVFEGFFSDNYFDMLPDKTYKIQFTAKDKTKELPKLELILLAESY